MLSGTFPRSQTLGHSSTASTILSDSEWGRFLELPDSQTQKKHCEKNWEDELDPFELWVVEDDLKYTRRHRSNENEIVL